MRLQLLLFIFSIGWRGQLSKIIANLGPTFCIVCPHSDSWLCTAWTQKELSTHGNTNLFQNFATSFCLAGFFEPPPGLKTWGPAFKSRAACWANCAEHYELLPCEIYFPISEMNFPINAQLVPISAHLTLFSLQIGHGSSRYDCWFFFCWALLRERALPQRSLDKSYLVGHILATAADVITNNWWQPLLRSIASFMLTSLTAYGPRAARPQVFNPGGWRARTLLSAFHLSLCSSIIASVAAKET